MKPHHIIALANDKDSYSFTEKDSKVITVPLFKHKTEKKRMFDTNIFELLAQRKFRLPSISIDLLNLASTVYSCDQLISRSSEGYMGWSRHFIVHLPVYHLDKWSSAKKDCEEMLSYLSGDKWELRPRSTTSPAPNQSTTSLPIIKSDAVVLFSGGLDSFIGAIDQLQNKKVVTLVSHHKLGGSESSVQEMLGKQLLKSYGPNSLLHLQFYLQPNQKNSQAQKESSSRARSFLFLCLGAAVASCYSRTTPLIVPENGLISLNIPLTATRLGSHSTRTTHPYYLDLLNSLLSKLGILSPIVNPYQFFTKGEMAKQVAGSAVFQKLFDKTMSCAHPDNGRWQGYTPNQHCGYCVPCIIRRAATKAAKLTDSIYRMNITDPSLSVHDKGADFKAFKIAIQKLNKMSPEQISFHILSAGPIASKSKKEFQKYVDLYRRGMQEVANIVK